MSKWDVLVYQSQTNGRKYIWIMDDMYGDAYLYDDTGTQACPGCNINEEFTDPLVDAVYDELQVKVVPYEEWSDEDKKRLAQVLRQDPTARPYTGRDLVDGKSETLWLDWDMSVVRRERYPK